MPRARRGTCVFPLSPVLAVKLPGVGENYTGCRPSEEHRAIPREIKGHGMTEACGRTGFGKLSPFSAVPLPAIADLSLLIAPTKQNGNLPFSVVHQGRITALVGANIIHLGPERAVPDPSVPE